MCGIVAGSGSVAASTTCVAGLKRLQYRGYDSYGFAWATDGGLQRLRSTDALDDMEEHLPESTAVLGHTRWATHGGVTLPNCHPHMDSGGRFALVHNGIVENYQSLRAGLSGAVLLSETDTEVIVHLLAARLDSGSDRLAAVRAVFDRLEGRNTFVVLFADGEMVGVRQGSPLVLGRATDCVYLASDVLSFSPWTTCCFPLPENALVRLKGNQVEAFSPTGEALDINWAMAEVDPAETGRDGYRHFMLKEIMEQWRTIPQQAVTGANEFEGIVDAIRQAGTVVVTGAGGAYYAARQIAWYLCDVADVTAMAVPAYEMAGARTLVKPGDVLLAISQSGETADTIEAVRTASSWGLRIATLVNMPMSSLSRMSEMSFLSRSGPEICVLSTKSASAQITFGYLLAHALIGQDYKSRCAIDALSTELTHYLCDETVAASERIAQTLAGCSHLFVLGRNAFYGSALMAALNIKEASYIHAEAFTAGELKHGVIALIEPGTPVILFAPTRDRYMLNVAAEVRSRGAYVVALADEDNDLFDARLPLPRVEGSAAVITSIVPGQLLAYQLGLARGVNPDKPRNLAKSVTVT